MRLMTSMKRLLRAVAVSALMAGVVIKPLWADEPVVVELYTSQGCISCPPADEILSKLAEKPDVIALALHVDYWDYIGWKDVFARPEYTERQKAYARASGARTIYTPQMVIDGTDHVVGAQPMDTMDLLAKHRARPKSVELSAWREGNEVKIQAEALRPVQSKLMIQLVRYTPQELVEITHGENAGKTIVYSNIVRDWQLLGEWDGAAPLEMRAPAPGDRPGVVILQEPGPGAIWAAARME